MMFWRIQNIIIQWFITEKYDKNRRANLLGQSDVMETTITESDFMFIDTVNIWQHEKKSASLLS